MFLIRPMPPLPSGHYIKAPLILNEFLWKYKLFLIFTNFNLSDFDFSHLCCIIGLFWLSSPKAAGNGGNYGF
jgi:hypothetical protein